MGPVTLHAHRESGFTLIEVMIAGLLLSIGLVALAHGYTVGFAMVVKAQHDTLAYQKAREALESVLTGRNTKDMTFDQIDNVGTGQGIFLTGFQPLYRPGSDGVSGTADDAAAGLETITLPGPDGLLGTSDDVVQPLTNYQRKIEITDLNLTGTLLLKQIKVTVQYTTSPKWTRSVVVVSYVSPYI
jgi:prepilin-type N-terminal cleavage/methylation domain-containing protein